MNTLLDKAFDPEIFRKQGHELVDRLANYLATCLKGDISQVLPWKEPNENLDRWQTDFSKPGGEKGLMEFFDDIIRGSIHLHHPKNMGHQVVPPVPPAALTGLLSALLNNSMAIYEVGPLSSPIEKIVTDWTASALGMGPGAGGILTSGGTIGNLTGLLAARQNRAGYDTWEEGVKENHRLAVMVSSESHYSIARAVKIMGLGEQGIVKVPVNERKEIDHQQLENCFQEAQKEGKKVIALVGNACTTSTGSYDPLVEMAAFCEKHDLWFHIDGAHGAAAALTSTYRHLVKGIERADSVVVDYHKMLLCPSLITAVVFKNNDHSYETFSQKASYLLTEKKRDNWYDIAQRTLECTKKMMGVTIYALLKTYGKDLFAEYITTTYDLTRSFAAIIKESGDFELAMEPAANIVCFRFVPPGKSAAELDSINANIRSRLKEEGEFYIVQTIIDDRVYLRTTLMNAFTRQEHLLALMKRIRDLYQEK